MSNPLKSSNEEDLRRQLRAAMGKIKSREPLDPTYKRLLLNGIVTPRRPVLPKDKFYKRLGSDLRPRVEAFLQQNQGKDLFDRIAQRQPLEESAMRAALTLRDAKEHEQQSLLDATLASLPRRNGMDANQRRKHLDAIALGLHTQKPPRESQPLSAAEQTELARQQAERDQQRERARQREAARRRRDDEQKQRDQDVERKRKQLEQTAETPKRALHKLYAPIFKKLWDMEFPHLGGTNPFRIVIDPDNCAAMGAPDYFAVVRTPMNLTRIQEKVESMEYAELSSFFADVDLVIDNCLLYNSDASNPYNIAAQELRKRYHKLVKKVMQVIQSRQSVPTKL
jgi:hypothetical protein